MKNRSYPQLVVIAIAAAVVIVGALIVAEVSRRQSLYWYDPSDDYEYGFGAGHVVTSQANVSSDSLIVPMPREEWVAAMKPVWEEFKGDVGQENIDAAQKINMTH